MCYNIISLSPSSVGGLAQQHALQLLDLALFLWQHQAALCSLLLFQQLLDVAGGAQQDVACGLHGEDGPSQKLPGSRARKSEKLTLVINSKILISTNTKTFK